MESTDLLLAHLLSPDSRRGGTPRDRIIDELNDVLESGRADTSTQSAIAAQVMALAARERDQAALESCYNLLGTVFHNKVCESTIARYMADQLPMLPVGCLVHAIPIIAGSNLPDKTALLGSLIASEHPAVSAMADCWADAQLVVAVVRHNNVLQWYLSDHENWILDWTKWRNAFIAEGYTVPELQLMLPQRAGIAVLDQYSADAFLNSSAVHRLDLRFLRNTLLARFPSAASWWDVSFLFPMVFVDFDRQWLAACHPDGPRLEIFVPDGWTGEFLDVANSCPEQIFPAADKFWLVEGVDLLRVINERGQHQDGA